MDATRIDSFARNFTTTLSRRTALGLTVGGTLFGLLTRCDRGDAAAKKGRKKRLNRYEYGFVDVGKHCRGRDGNCCSGICQGKKPKKGKKDTSTCVAHDVEGCQANQDGSLNEAEDHCPDKPAAWCYWTTGKSSFCGFGGAGMRVECARDTDCEAGFGEGAACVITTFCPNEHATACTPRNLI